MNFSVFVLLVVGVACVSALNCPSGNPATDCGAFECTNHFHKECVQNICTCTTNNGPCTQQVDCTQLGIDCHHGSWHCFDKVCRCGGGGFFGPGGNH